MLVLRFTSESTATLTWKGGTIHIERFNFAVGNDSERLLGEWMITIGTPLAPVYFGERLTLSGIDNEGTVIGIRTGNEASPIIAKRMDGPAQGYWYFGALDSSKIIICCSPLILLVSTK
jgi:hypothetical protein